MDTLPNRQDDIAMSALHSARNEDRRPFFRTMGLLIASTAAFKETKPLCTGLRSAYDTLQNSVDEAIQKPSIASDLTRRNSLPTATGHKDALVRQMKDTVDETGASWDVWPSRPMSSYRSR